MDMKICKGEILGLAGLLGSGRTETAQLVFGIDKADSGELLLEGKPVHFNSPRQAIMSRFRIHAREPQKSKASSLIFPFAKTSSSPCKRARAVAKTLSRKNQDEIAEKYIELLGISTPSADQTVMNLSGGNQQKVCWRAGLPLRPAPADPR